MSQETIRKAREKVVLATLAFLGAERAPYINADAMTALKAAEDDVALAARDLTNAIDDSPPSQRPAGWALDGDESG